MRSILAILVACTITLPVRAQDTPLNPDAPRTLQANEAFVAPTSGAFITDAYATAKLHAFQRVCLERDEFKKALTGKDDHTTAIVSTFVVGTSAGVVLTLLLIGLMK